MCCGTSRGPPGTRIPETDDRTDFDPLANAGQLADVRGLLERLPDDAEVVAGGAALDRAGYVHQATVVTGLR